MQIHEPGKVAMHVALLGICIVMGQESLGVKFKTTACRLVYVLLEKYFHALSLRERMKVFFPFLLIR